MALILDFRARPDAQADRSETREPAEPVGAQIIIFPGVRRERNADPPKPRRRSRPKRDRLELPD